MELLRTFTEAIVYSLNHDSDDLGKKKNMEQGLLLTYVLFIHLDIYNHILLSFHACLTS